MAQRVDSALPAPRLRAVNSAPLRPRRRYVLYWMTAARRTRWNFGLERAVELATELGRPLVVLEALRCGYRWASARHQRFVLDGMADNERACAASAALYYPYVEPEAGAGRGLLAELGKDACAVVTDDYPAFFLPRMVEAAGAALDVRLEAVDSSGLFPMRATERVFARAFDFRRFLQRELAPHLAAFPSAEPLGAELPACPPLPERVTRRWPRAEARLLDGDSSALAELPIDHGVAPVSYRGGPRAGEDALRTFLTERLARYGDDRNRPDRDGASGLSPYLHFGHLSVHQVFAELASAESWSPERLSSARHGKRTGWWGMGEAAESFLDELVTWRELGFNRCAHDDAYDQYASLPEWARTTLEEHAADPRPYVYDLATFESAATHDELWNAAQNQLRIEGRIHNYLRMLWGKKILHWSASPRAALEILIELNNKYAVDGRDPNSYSGIFWTLGRYDRAWGPEREVFGKIRYMTSDSTRRKLKVDAYIERWEGWQPSFDFSSDER